MTDTKTLHPTGFFTAKITDSSLRETNTGSIYILLRVDTGVDEIFSRLYMTEKAAPYTAEKLKALGFVNHDILELDEPNNALIGTECEVLVKHETGQDGKVYVNASIWTGSKEREKLEPKKLKRFSAFNALLKDSGSPKPANGSFQADPEDCPF